jgi:hypothetical protein
MMQMSYAQGLTRPHPFGNSLAPSVTGHSSGPSSCFETTEACFSHRHISLCLLTYMNKISPISQSHACETPLAMSVSERLSSDPCPRRHPFCRHSRARRQGLGKGRREEREAAGGGMENVAAEEEMMGVVQLRERPCRRGGGAAAYWDRGAGAGQ